ncbi:hypothetical protein ABHA37_08200 [Clostridium tertium]|uniref:hypothetical protein n=1 Tax=Clostridium tertium TaxID=1559 RepID=UPI00232AD3FC|nr:hypothetical protein [Clostridium tertium]MDB1923394.1 hypothetical protein [Clostridium tertium]MDB1929999.1 hypothetical protein [Clostridium tertium]
MIVKLYDFFKENNIECYFIGQHQGECIRNYVVLKDNGVKSLDGKVGTGYVDIIFYVPKNKFTKCELFKKEVKEIMKEFKNLKYTGIETGMVTDDEKKAITFSIMYENYKRL